MKHVKTTPLFFIFILLISAIVYLNTQQEAKKEMAQVNAYVTEKGQNFWMMQDDYLPIVTLKISFSHAGSAYDDEEKMGLANMVASLLSEGAGEYDATEYYAALESIATDISFWVDKDYFHVSLKTISDHLPQAMQLLGVALTQPTFASKDIERIRHQIQIYMLRQQRQPDYLAGKTLREELFSDHPYSYPIEGKMETITHIAQKDLQEFVASKFIKQAMFLSVVGDVSLGDTSMLIDKHLTLPNDAQNNAKKIAELEAYKINKEPIHVFTDAPQTVIHFAMPAPLRNDADFYPVYLLNYMLGGGGFESRLMKNIREDKGLVYSVYSSYVTYGKTGLLVGSAATENKSADKTIREIENEFKKVADAGFTQQELDDAKSYMIHSFPLKMTKNEYLVSFLDVMQRDHLAIDFLQKRNALVNAVTLKQVNKAAKKWIRPKKLLIVSAGNKP